MCGRFTLTVDAASLARMYSNDIGELAEWQPTFSIAPTERVPVVRERLDKDTGTVHREISPMEWGLRPSWATTPGPKPINARLETAATKRMFQQAFNRHRAIVPMSGYFEWVPEDGKKQPYYLFSEDHPILHAAGLYAMRKDEHGEWQLTFAIITTDATDAAGRVHDRMPVLMPDELAADWVDPARLASGEEMTARLAAAAEASAKTLQVRKVSRRVNSVQTADPHDASLLDPV
ncbi:SOS response-associated peptidase [Brevibacterium daeguense]|uniref:Abasic site processing protein n=1 Tax=Brevibacterium daeguense TaxID=909936 RepID=A0ABP8EIL5_9MICO|nr:SOS response-associated peptidase [Brevibacterium daeguense]